MHQNLNILYRDDLLIAVAKPSGMVVHRGWANDSTTVADILRDGIVGHAVHAVHRLDRGTSGVLLFALNPDAARFVNDEFESGRAE
ncbi:MAG TPA: pseudouridine synthase, partial [Candidatus Obscuribacterales bacterium]